MTKGFKEFDDMVTGLGELLEHLQTEAKIATVKDKPDEAFELSKFAGNVFLAIEALKHVRSIITEDTE